ncbi:MAG TPA: agmatine deiminase family protein [Candidatus Sulfotelmatobacter sp.]
MSPTQRKSPDWKSEWGGSSPPVGRYCMPAEWERHTATWLAWPHYQGDWPGKFEPIPWVYAEIVRNVARQERVDLIVKDAVAERRVRKILQRADVFLSNVGFHRWRTNRVWIRDSGCIFVAAQEPGKSPTSSAMKFRFNAWAKYSNWKHDEKIGSLMAVRCGAEEVHPTFSGKRVVLEGGSIDVNGKGTLLTTEECLLSKVQRRNPGMNRSAYERIFAEYLGAQNVIWLSEGISGDDTHGHIDDLARFVSPDSVVTVVESDKKDVNFRPLRENLRRLRSSRDQAGKQFNIVELPMPRPISFEGRRLPASYANFYIANELVLVPVFNDPNDRLALNTLAELFPSRDVIPIYCGDLVWGLGALHCMTQQQPAAEPAPLSGLL